MIELKHVSAGYPGRDVLQSVSAAFRPGRVTVLLGPNGCGKSTLLRAACGLLPKTSGEILLDGVPLERLSPRQTAQKVAYLPQSRAVPNITARRMVLHGRFPYLSYPRRYRQSDYEAARNALEQTGALELADRSVAELSGGQRQKVYLAMALAQDTETILMDEPTTYLDIRHQMEVMELCRRLAQQGKAVVLVLHDLCLAMETADKILLMQDGVLKLAGTPEELYVSELLSEVMGINLQRVQTEEGWRYFCGLP